MGVFDVEVEFIPVATWKTKLGINLTHSKQFNSAKKELKDNKYGSEWNTKRNQEQPLRN